MKHTLLAIVVLAIMAIVMAPVQAAAQAPTWTLCPQAPTDMTVQNGQRARASEGGGMQTTLEQKRRGVGGGAICALASTHSLGGRPCCCALLACCCAVTLVLASRTLNLAVQASVDETVSAGALVTVAVSLGGGQM